MRQLLLPFGFAPRTSLQDFYQYADCQEILFQLQHYLSNATNTNHASPASASAKQFAQEMVFFIWGSQGIGKSHLLQAGCQEVHQQGGHAGYLDLAVLSPDAFTVLEGLEHQDLLCIDNLQVINSHEYAEFQLGLFKLFNLMRENNRRLIVASNVNIHYLTHILPDLQSRLQWGLSYQLKPMAQSQRLDFVCWLSSRRGMSMSQEMAHFILRRAPRSTTALVNIIQQLETATLMHQRKLTIPFVKQVLGY